MEKISALYDANFGIEQDDPPKFKGTMVPTPGPEKSAAVRSGRLASA
jgi:hypothetical protein